MRTRIIAIFASAALYAALMGGISLYQFLKNSGADRRRDEVLASLRERAPMLINAALKSPAAVTLEEYDFLDNFSREPGLVELVYLSADETVRWHRQPGAIGRPSGEILHEASFATGVVARAFSTLSFAAGRAPSGDLEVVVPFSVKRRPVTLLAFTLSAAEHRRAAAAGVVRYSFLALSAVLLLPSLRPPAAAAARAEIPPRTGSPYVGAIVVDAETGGTVFEENADAECYPASIVKLMDLLIILERVGEKSLDLQEPVTTTAETSRIGGSQVYLAENETFTVEELLYALMVQSANDAAVALALHVAGSTEGFVRLMQEKADKLGMTSTRFASVHGLPPDKGKEPDLSTPRDLA
ncbi:MAG TPA: serine hydrolase, partial [Elusimicrobiales bacterium]|nr:serine hydrolase [Elusimicrobiales bacterium]